MWGLGRIYVSDYSGCATEFRSLKKFLYPTTIISSFSNIVISHYVRFSREAEQKGYIFQDESGALLSAKK